MSNTPSAKMDAGDWLAVEVAVAVAVAVAVFVAALGTELGGGRADVVAAGPFVATPPLPPLAATGAGLALASEVATVAAAGSAGGVTDCVASACGFDGECVGDGDVPSGSGSSVRINDGRRVSVGCEPL